MSRRPVVGITSYLEPAKWGVWDRRAALVPYPYLAHLTAAGARVVLLPPDDLDADVLDRLDGLVLAGGADVGPGNYGHQPHARTVTRPDRDSGELVLLRAALAADRPVLGICRGMQLMAVAAGGTLHQHLPEVIGHERHQPAPATFGEIRVSTEPGSRIEAVLGLESTVTCYHHQSVADPGSLTVTARASDGVIEAVEDQTRRFALGVQWHPEELVDGAVFRAFVEAAG